MATKCAYNSGFTTTQDLGQHGKVLIVQCIGLGFGNYAMQSEVKALGQKLSALTSPIVGELLLFFQIILTPVSVRITK